MAVFGIAPDFTRISIRVTDLSPAGRESAAQAYLKRAARSADRASIRRSAAAWREVYAAAGLGQDALPPHETLLAWAESPSGVPTQNPVLDLVNALALQRGVPTAAYDLERTQGNVWLRPSRGIESHTRLDGHHESPPVGELILADSADVVLARHWHGAPGQATHPASHAREVLVHLDFLAPPEGLAEALDEFERLFAGMLGGRADARALSKGGPVVEWQPA